MLDINERLNNFENRLLEIELKLGMANLPGTAGTPAPAPVTAPAPATPAVTATSPPTLAATPTATLAATPAATLAAKPVPVRQAEAAPARPWADIDMSPPRATPPRTPAKPPEPVSTTQLMAWAAGFALLLAAVYFLKLVYDVGWLTPERQLLIATLAGFGLIAGGIFAARFDRGYAAYLPALGLIVLYLSAYTAHLYYHLANSQTAIAAVSAITVLGIWLGRRFDQSVYVVLAATGVYLSPLLMQAVPERLFDVVIYYTAWSLLFSFCALNEGRRITYVLPMFFALIGFDLLWRASGQSSWLLAVFYQLTQFLVFASTAAAFTIIHKRPLNDLDGMTHGFALIYFYALEYVVLEQHVPKWAPVIGMLSAVLVLLIYVAARMSMKDRPMGVGAVVVSAYCSLVTAHAVFIEWMPQGWLPWGALAMTAAVGLAFAQSRDKGNAAWKPVLIVAGLIFCGSYLGVLIGGNDRGVAVMPNTALALYSAVLYAGYHLFSRDEGGARAAPVVLYGAHFAFMEWGLHVFGNGLPISMVWAVFAVAILIVAIMANDKLLGQSSLLIFCASGLKVLVRDLAGSGSLVRVVTLIVLAVSLYAGGWLYQSLVRRVADAD